MASESNWRSSLKAVDRYDNIESLKRSIGAKAAFAKETEAYNTSTSRDVYDAACYALTADLQSEVYTGAEPNSLKISIGPFECCHHISSGLVSEVYRSGAVALKVITETQNVQPHNAGREVKILRELSHVAIIKLLDTYNDNEGRLTLAFPFMPLTLEMVIGAGSMSEELMRTCFHDILSGIGYFHENGIIHRDIKPSNILLASKAGPAYIADFGTAWHPNLSILDEPANCKILEVGTTCYRTPETLFGNRSYSTSLDMWAVGAMVAECLRKPPRPLFESRDTSEDGNQLGLILSIFKTIGTPTRATWPEAVYFSTPPFEWYQDFPGHSWETLLPDVDERARDLVKNLVCYESSLRLTAVEALEHQYWTKRK